MNATQQAHLDTCRSPGCPVCRVLARSGSVRADGNGGATPVRQPRPARGQPGAIPGVLTALPLPATTPPVKPRMSLGEVAQRNRRCREQKAAGKPCTAWSDLPAHFADMAAPPEAFAPLRWAVGLTTVPERRDTYLPTTLASLEKAGFASPHLFVDGDSQGPRWRSLGLPASFRDRRIGAYGNWLLGIWELFIRNPDCDRYAMFQDDFVTLRHLRDYLDRSPYPDVPSALEPGYLNLYSFPVNEALCPNNGNRVGWYRASSEYRGRGAVALVFSRQAVNVLLTGERSSKHLFGRLFNPDKPQRQSEAIDGGVVEAMNHQKFWEYVHSPSLVQHTGDVSALKHGEFPKADTFPGEDYDAMRLLSWKGA